MEKIEIKEVTKEEIEPLSVLATSILREHYDPIVGVEQNNYMLNKFQSVQEINDQFNHGYIYKKKKKCRFYRILSSER